MSSVFNRVIGNYNIVGKQGSAVYGLTFSSGYRDDTLLMKLMFGERLVNIFEGNIDTH